MSFLSTVGALTPAQRNTFLASFLAWTLDAFDFFVVIFVASYIAADFGTTVVAVLGASALTLMFRPVGALIFGYLADKYGRRRPLVANIIAFSVLELACAFAPNLAVFLVLRALFGIAMGGVWGIGAALSFETLPAETRGFFSGILQQGYAVGYLLNALLFGLVFPHVGWRGMFIIGTLPALLAIFVERNVPESEVWKRGEHKQAKDVFPLWTSIRKNWKLSIYAVLLMTAFNCMSHGTQDVYPTFLKLQRGFLPGQVSIVTTVASIGAIVGGTFFGAFSQRVGRRRAIITAAVIGLVAAAFWTTGMTLAALALGGFFIQLCVQGAWGVIPAHLTELSPSESRASFPGFVYQLGNLLASYIAPIEAYLASHNFVQANGIPNYGRALVTVASIVFVLVALLTAFGPERREVDFTRLAVEEA